MPYIESSMNEFLEIANEGLLGAKKKSVDQLLADAEKRYNRTLKTVGDCDDQLVIINNEGRKFNECIRTISKVKKQYDQGKLTKKQFNEQFRSANYLLKKNCKALQIQLGNVVDDASAVTAQELKDFSQFISGLKKIVTRIRKSLMNKAAKESYLDMYSALEGEFDLSALEEEESKSSKKDDDDDKDKDDDKKDKKKKDTSEDDFDGEPLEEKDDKKKDKDKDDDKDKDKDDDDEDDKDDDDKDKDDDKKDKKKKDKKDDDEDDDEDDDDDKDDDKDDDEDDDEDKKKDKDKDDDEDEEKKKSDAKECAHVFASAVIDEALEIASEWGIDYEEAFDIAKETVDVRNYNIDPALEYGYGSYYSGYDEDAKSRAATAGVVAAGVGVAAAAALQRSYLAQLADYRDMPKGAAKDEFGFQLAEQLRKNPILVATLKGTDKWDRIPVELRMYVRDQRAIPYSRNGVPMFSNYRAGRR